GQLASSIPGNNEADVPDPVLLDLQRADLIEIAGDSALNALANVKYFTDHDRRRVSARTACWTTGRPAFGRPRAELPPNVAGWRGDGVAETIACPSK